MGGYCEIYFEMTNLDVGAEILYQDIKKDHSVLNSYNDPLSEDIKIQD